MLFKDWKNTPEGEASWERASERANGDQGIYIDDLMWTDYKCSDYYENNRIKLEPIVLTEDQIESNKEILEIIEEEDSVYAMANYDSCNFSDPVAKRLIEESQKSLDQLKNYLEQFKD